MHDNNWCLQAFISACLTMLDRAVATGHRVIHKRHPHKGRKVRQNADKADNGEGGFQGMQMPAVYIQQTSKTGEIVPMNCVFSLTVMLTTALVA